MKPVAVETLPPGSRPVVKALEVWASFDDAPWREMDPESVVVASAAEIAPIVERAIALGAVVTVVRAEVGDDEGLDDPDLDDWPAERHVIRRSRNTEEV